MYGTILGKFSYKAIYFTGFLMMILFLLTSFLTLKNIPDPKYDKTKTLKYLKKYFKDKNLFRAFGMTFLLQLFYCWMVIYTPIYLYSYLHFSWSQIGVIFTIMLLPFMFIPVKLGKYADRIGERKILMSGFAIMGLSALALFFITESAVFIWAILLFITRLGAATVEPMSDTYFFRHIKMENEEFIGVYRSASPMAYIIAPILALLIFYFTPAFKFLFPILGALMLSGVYLASTINRSDI
jgi:MFS family permease